MTARSVSEDLKQRLRAEAEQTANRVVGVRMSNLCRDALAEIERLERCLADPPPAIVRQIVREELERFYAVRPLAGVFNHEKRPL